ncbi:MAG TPA: hypothetical protein VHL78_13245 [Actinomycetota bacterium]|nr:hypothetical protein [Actinomycetota bacterium]
MSLRATPPRHGHAIECRIYAEDPRTFLPAPGTIGGLTLPAPRDERAVRCDFGYEAGDAVPMFYDPLLGKVVVHADERTAAVGGMDDALHRLDIGGVKTNVPALLGVLADDRFRSGEYDTGLLGK